MSLLLLALLFLALVREFSRSLSPLQLKMRHRHVRSRFQLATIRLAARVTSQQPALVIVSTTERTSMRRRQQTYDFRQFVNRSRATPTDIPLTPAILQQARGASFA